MPDAALRECSLAGARVDAAAFALRPGYRSAAAGRRGLRPGSEQPAKRRAAPGGAIRGPRRAVRPNRNAPEHLEPREVAWCDDDRVTCRRWNWRQAHRTRLREDTTTALFMLDALHPLTDALHAADDALHAHLTRFGPDVRAARRLLTAPHDEA